MQYYQPDTQVKRKSSTRRILVLVNVVLLAGFLYVLALPYI